VVRSTTSERVVFPEGVTFEAASVGGISGWWAKPRHETSLASSRRMLASMFSSQITGSRLSTRFPPPSAIFQACYQGLIDSGITRIALPATRQEATWLGASVPRIRPRLQECHCSRWCGRFFANHGSRAHREELLHASRSGSVLHQVSGRRSGPILLGYSRSEESPGLASLRGSEGSASGASPRRRRGSAARRLDSVRRARRRGRCRCQAGSMDGNAARIRH